VFFVCLGAEAEFDDDGLTHLRLCSAYEVRSPGPSCTYATKVGAVCLVHARGVLCIVHPNRPHPPTQVETNCTALSLIPTVNGNMVRSFSTHGHQSAAKGSLTTVSCSDIRLIQHLDSSGHGLVRRWRLIGYFPTLPPGGAVFQR
jgi:hypothetical protein